MSSDRQGLIVLLIDTETSGLIDNHTLPLDKQPEVIEYYHVLMDLVTGEVFDECDLLIKPVTPISDEITRITHITNAMLEGAPRFVAGADRIARAIEAAPAVIAHNLSFDKEMIDIEFERLGRALRWPRLICSVEQTIHLTGYRLSLMALHQHLFNEPFPEAHRARNDVQALARCCAELARTGAL